MVGIRRTRKGGGGGEGTGGGGNRLFSLLDVFVYVVCFWFVTICQYTGQLVVRFCYSIKIVQKPSHYSEFAISDVPES